MAKKKHIKIDAQKCVGCGLCVPNCPKGVLKIIDGKARLISDFFCDGLGGCIGRCPQGAITIEEKEAREYDEQKALAGLIKEGEGVVKAHLEYLRESHYSQYLQQALGYLKEKGIKNPLSGIKSDVSKDKPHVCPGLKIMTLHASDNTGKKEKRIIKNAPELTNWPVQLMLIPPQAPYLKNAHLLIAADCVPFVYADFHQDFLKGKILAIGCPKLDDLEAYRQKLAQIIEQAQPKSITYAHMEVSCCFGLVNIIQSAISASGKSVPFKEVNISLKGKILS